MWKNTPPPLPTPPPPARQNGGVEFCRTPVSSSGASLAVHGTEWDVDGLLWNYTWDTQASG